MRSYLIFLIAIITLIDVFALNETMNENISIAYGYITISIINRPPRITKLTILPQEVYPDSILNCDVELIDERPNKVILHYKWYINGILTNLTSISGLKPGDIVTCKVIPEDSEGLKGKEVSVTKIVKRMPARIKFMKYVINSAGINATTEKVVSLYKEGFGSITGFVVKELDTSTKTKGILWSIILGLFLINLLLRIKSIFKVKHMYS